MAVSAKAVAKVAGLVIGVPLSVVLIATAFFKIDVHGGQLLTPRFDFGHFVHDIPSHLHWLIPFFLLSASVIPLRALQWQATLAKKVPFKERYHLVGIGAFIHNALPGKFGDVFRSFLMARTQKLPFVQSLGSVAVCKLLEFAALMLLVVASFLGPFGATMSRFAGPMRIAIAICLALMILVVVLAHYAEALSHALARRKRFPRLQPFLLNVSKGLGTARSAKGMAVALALSIPPVLAPALAYGIALQNIGVQGGFFAGAVVLGAIALGQATPGLPAGTGIYYFVTSWTARSLGASPEDAAAFAALTHLGTILSQVSVGLISVLVRRIRLKDLRSTTGAAAEAMKHVSDEAQTEQAAARA
jgi:glycosyltransferase 2 family protein